MKIFPTATAAVRNADDLLTFDAGFAAAAATFPRYA